MRAATERVARAIGDGMTLDKPIAVRVLHIELCVAIAPFAQTLLQTQTRSVAQNGNRLD
jgi:hypothetical protein